MDTGVAAVPTGCQAGAGSKMGNNSGKTDQLQNGFDRNSGALAEGGTILAAAQQFAVDPASGRGAEAARQARRLIAAANELLALAAELEEMSRQGRPRLAADIDPAAAESSAMLEDDARWLRGARRTYRNRRSRNALFGDDGLFGEPAWDLLLDLFIAAKERKRVPVTSACIGAAVPTTTALRWLAVLEERGLVVREADPSDARRIFVRLSTEAYARMVNYFVRTAMNDAEDTIESARASGRAIERMWI